MGGGYYDRDDDNNDYQPQNLQQANYNMMPHEDVKPTLDPSLDPKRWTMNNDKLISQHKNPIIFALDVTGSMGEWTKVNIHLLKFLIKFILF